MTDTVISLFTGGMGLDLGFTQECFQVKAVVESDPAAIDTIRANVAEPPLLLSANGRRPLRIEEVPTEDLLKKAGLGVGEATVVLGAPPCEPYTTVGSRNGKADHRANGVHEYIRVVREARPRFFVLEEVPSFLSAAIRHIPFYERIAMRSADVPPDARLGSYFDEVMAEFSDTGYTLSFDHKNPRASILNAADFGAAQNRKRFILIGSRDGPAVPLPTPSGLPYKTLGQVLDEVDDPCPQYQHFPKNWGKYMPQVPEGGCWRDLPPEIQKEVMGGAFDYLDNPRTKGKKGGRTGFMRRLSREKPAPTLVDSPTTKAASLCHPCEDRPLSVKEYAALQGFPDDWQFVRSMTAKYRLIGQATPVPLARAIAKEVRAAIAQG